MAADVFCVTDGVEKHTATALASIAMLDEKAATRLQRFPAKWKPVRVKKTGQNKNLEPRSDSIGTEKAQASPA